VTQNVSLAGEILLLDQARAALAAGDAPHAAALLDRYAASRPSAVLAQEAALLRVRLLLKQGDRAGAAQLARRIIHEYPSSRHVDSLRSLAAEP
jgi:outer membrane protein assembly factor BamD (BamD/ComL family)